MEKDGHTGVSAARAQLALAAAALTATAALLAYWPPQHYSFYPRCPVHALGFECPGCGLTRALADLLAGNLRLALEHNALAVAMLPLAVAFALWQTYSVLRWNRWRPMRFSRPWAGVAYAAVAIFGVGRNCHLSF